jgi:uncharacterized protein (DUF2236 family)
MLKSAIDENRAVAASGKPWLQTYAVADEANVVDRDRFEAALEKIRSRVSNPKHGLFGPGSMMWRVYGEQVTGVGGFRALLLQTAHPFIAHAVQQKSAYRTDPQGRAERTFRAVIDWVYRDLDAALASARTVFRVHNRIVGPIANRVGPYEQGDHYAANEQRSAFWVHATGVDSALRLYEHVYGPLSRDERERYNEESKLFALLFGVDEAIIPPTFGDFQEYVDRMFESDVLTPDQASRDIAKYVMSAPTKQAVPAFAWLRIMTAGLLPPRVRHGYQFDWGTFERAVFASSMRALRAGVPRLPPELRRSVFYRHAMHKAMQTEPGSFERRVDRTLERMAESAARAPEQAAGEV